ncbi:MAG: hypothetical protein NXI22_17025 [bacterium]|nr:hypothetical protein [bacterium]
MLAIDSGSVRQFHFVGLFENQLANNRRCSPFAISGDIRRERNEVDEIGHHRSGESQGVAQLLQEELGIGGKPTDIWRTDTVHFAERYATFLLGKFKPRTNTVDLRTFRGTYIKTPSRKRRSLFRI